MTRDGIERDLQITPYKTVVGNLVLCFSSLFYQRKFTNGFNDFSETVFKRYKFDKFLLNYNQMEEMSEALAILYYNQIEKRGFRIERLDAYDSETTQNVDRPL